MKFKQFTVALPLLLGLALLANACETSETEIETPTGETEIERPTEAPAVSPAPDALPSVSPVPTTPAAP